MVDNFQFGGGANASTMTSFVLGITLLATLLFVGLKRKYAAIPVLLVTFLTPFGAQVLIGGFHFFVIRIFVIAGLLRMASCKATSRGSVFGGPLTIFDKIILLWECSHIVTFILLYREAGAVAVQAASALDVLGVYFIFRYLLQGTEDILRAVKALTIVAAVMAACMSYESATRINVFSYINTHTIVPWLREGKVRAQGVFGNSITAGTFGATLMPLFFWLIKSGKAKIWGFVGIVSASLIALTSVASTGVTAYLGGIVALCLWPLRRRMRMLRWGLVITVACLAVAMKAPVWFIIARVDVIGGHGWDRAALIDQFMGHWSEWWLLGTSNSASWGADTWDACNQFVAEGVGGGLICLVLFTLLLSRGFGAIGTARERSEGNRQREWFFWCLGAAMFAHVVAFWGIDYFDQTHAWWFIFLAMIPASTSTRDFFTGRKNTVPTIEVEAPSLIGAGSCPEEVASVVARFGELRG